MQTIEDISYGVVPFYKEGEEWKVFLIHQYGSSGDVFWTFPKGHPEAGESPEESAQRELLEETGLQVAELFPEHAYTQNYSFRHEDTMIHKTVMYFLGVVPEKKYVVQAEEVKAAGWFSLGDALGQLTHDSTRAILTEALSDIDTI